MSEQPAFDTDLEGATIVDCGDVGEVTAVHRHDYDDDVYEIRFGDGDKLDLTERELELGIIDGTIKVKR